MKKIFTLLLFFSFSLGFITEASAQFVDVGTASGTNGTTTCSPINIWYRSMHYQVIYTAAELSAAGATPGGIITGLGWDVTGAPINPLPNYAIKMKHTTATSTATYDGVGLITTVTIPSYAPTAGGYDVQNFTSNFTWNGADNILVDICFDQVSAYNGSGQLSTFSGTGNFVRSDGSSQCGVATGGSTSARPIVRFAMTAGGPITCPQSSNLVVSGVTATTADLSWTSGGAPAWVTEYGVTGSFTPNSNQNGAITVTNPTTISGLNPATDYTVCVREFCAVGDTSFAICQNFTTPCVSYTAPYLETFDASLTLPNCWTNTNLSTDQWRFLQSGGTGPGYGVQGSVDHTSGSGNFTWIDASGGINANELISPDIDFSGLTQAVAGFWILSNNTTNGAQNTINLDAWDGSAWVNLTSYGGNFDGWKRILAVVPASIPTTTRFRLVQVESTTGTGNAYNNDLLVDDFFVDEAPTCFEPTNLNVTVLNANSAEISWTTGGASTWQIEYGPAPFAQGSGTIVPATTNPFTITGLTDNTEYFFYVQDSCSATDVSWWASGTTFETPCITYTAPWVYDVESANATTNGTIEDCWSSNPVGPTFSYRWNVWQPGQFTSGNTGPLAAYSNDKYFYVEASSGSTGTTATLFTPFVDISALTTPALMFQYHFFGNNIDRMYIDIFDGATWVLTDSIVGQQQTSETDPWIFDTVDLAAFSGVIQARFRAVKGNGGFGDMSLDDIRFDDIPTCFAPTSLMDSVIDPYSAQLSWTTGGAANWIVEYGPAGFTPGTGTSVTASTNPYVVTGLVPGTDYDWYVQDSCSATDVSWQSSRGKFRLPAVIYCDSTSMNFTYCHPDETVETFTYQSESGTGQLHVVFNAGQTGFSVDFAIYDGPDNTYPIIFTSTGNANMTGFEFTSSSSIITMVHNSIFANPCTTPLDFDINCCMLTTSSQDVYICKDSTYMLADSAVVSQTGSYTATIENYRGCDSVITYLVYVLPDSVAHEDKLCVGETYTFADGSTTTTPGSFQVTVPNQNGCDSTINYTITSISPSTSSMAGTFCQGDSYTLPDGSVVSAAGSYDIVFVNAVGCDSTLTVTLTELMQTSSTQNVQICEGETHELPDGVEATAAGTYTSVVTNVAGCDSTVTTNLGFAATTYSSSTVEICGDETYTLVNGEVIDESGEYNVSINNANGCDSIITVFVSKCNAIGGAENTILSIYPNPASNAINVILDDAIVNNANFKIVNAIGQTVYSLEKITSSSMKVDVTDFTNGMYFIVLSDSKSTSLHKFIVNK